MTPEMIALAERNKERAGATNVEYHLARIDRLPLPDASVDCVISNCVINLATDKQAVFHEIARVLKPGGRLAVSDIALKRALPTELSDSLAAYVGCVAGAISIDDYRAGLQAAGFGQVEIVNTGSDLNAYALADGQSACCAPGPSESALPVVDGGQSSGAFPEELRELMTRYNVNDYAASVKVYALKTSGSTFESATSCCHSDSGKCC
jgi:SAM-dependent methyltransferase